MENLDKQRVWELISEAETLGGYPEGLAKAEEAVRLADALEDEDLGFMTRDKLMDLAVWGGAYEKILVAFSWCLARADKNQDDYQGMVLLWKYKWVLEHLVHYPRITRQRIFAALNDFKERCLKSGYNDRPVLFLTWCLEMYMGNLDVAQKAYDAWRLTERDGLADCIACERNREVEFLALQGLHEKALREAEPILKGRMKCEEIPHVTHAVVLESFRMTDRDAEANQSHLAGYKLIRSNRDFIREQGWHIAYLVRVGQADDAVKLMRKHLPWALETHSLDLRFLFFIETLVLLKQLQTDGHRSLRMRLPVQLCPFGEKPTVQLKGLSDWLMEQAKKLAQQFDERNGNKWFSSMLSRV
jgi:hypothetical protein